MSAAIRTSLNKLNSAVVKLEGAIEAKKAAPKKAGQPDLFNPQQTGNINPMNVRMLASRLDKAIDQVESILKEARA